MNHQNVVYVANKNDLASEVKKNLQPNDMVITIGAGDIWKISNQLIEDLKK